MTFNQLDGKTPIPCALDGRFTFYIYAPKGHALSGPPLPLLVVIHGIKRDTDGYIDGLQKFCEDRNCALICPLFPPGIPHPKSENSYKELIHKGTRFDTILLSMIDQAAQICNLRSHKFYLHGFSAGGQFAHRFAYLHPNRLAAVSVGAPGRLTAPNTRCPWPGGVADVAELFAIPGAADFEQMARVPVQFVVGEQDLGTDMIKDMKNASGAEQEAGETRVERIQWLKKSWQNVGISSELAIVQGVGHNGVKCLHAVEEWLGCQMESRT